MLDSDGQAPRRCVPSPSDPTSEDPSPLYLSVADRSSCFNACESLPEIFREVPDCSIPSALAAHRRLGVRRVFISVQIEISRLDWSGVR
ncbi:hypothetical protein ACFX13_012837 [Malus domestica]